ncbi:MAG: pentapeptide repeat-containing protein [Desulfomonile tiedjei]|nr:pentapeptide repeat-containing protein [Desulfomonile tiedjei]
MEYAPHLAKLLEGVEAWNAWREANPEIKPILHGVDLSPQNLTGTSLYARDDLDGHPYAKLQNVNLAGATLTSSNLQFVNLCRANLRGAFLTYSNIQFAKFGAACLQKAHFGWGDIRNASFGDADLQRAYFEDADLSGSDFRKANLQGAILRGSKLCGANLGGANVSGADFKRADLEGANVTGVNFYPNSRQRKFQGIRAATCYGNQIFRSFAQDQDYIETLRATGLSGEVKFWLWWLFADCGRSFVRWALWSLGLAILFGYIYYWMGSSHFKLDHLTFDFLSMTYYSVVTFTTLGFGDVKPCTPEGAAVVVIEVILGYLMLGGLISILANKIARRA